VTRISETPPELAAFQEALFDRVERGRIEQGQPRNNINLTLNHTIRGFGVNLHNQRFGEVSQLHATDPAMDQTFSARWISDLDLSYRSARSACASPSAPTTCWTSTPTHGRTSTSGGR
jgi:iron complex outermembrane recepter protein